MHSGISTRCTSGHSHRRHRVLRSSQRQNRVRKPCNNTGGIPLPPLSHTWARSAAQNEGPYSVNDDASDEGSTMVPLDPEDTSGDTFGPLAVLLVGFMEPEIQQFKEMMLYIDAAMVKVVPCTRRMLTEALGDALEADEPQYEQPPLGLRRSVVLSGMFSAEMIGVINHYQEAGLPPAVFASAVPNNYGRSVGDICKEIHQEHAAMARMQQRRQQA